MLVWVPTPDGASFMGELPAGTEVVFWNGLEPLPAGADEVEFLVPNWVSKEAIVPLLRTLPRLKVIQVLNAATSGSSGSTIRRFRSATRATPMRRRSPTGARRQC